MDPHLQISLNARGMAEVYDAIDTYDMAKVVRAAMKAVDVVLPQFIQMSEAKSDFHSTVCRQQGNENYKAGRFRQAVELYNKALALAPKYSEEMILAYGNRSAVFFSIKYFSACVSDVNTCLALRCSTDLAKKLRKRRDDAMPYVDNEMTVQVPTDPEFVDSYLRFNCKRNADVPCASADVSFVTRDGAKRATARNDVRPGTLMALERAFVTCHIKNTYSTCYYCHRSELCLYPCDGCCEALFCGNDCAAQCMKEYHCIECKMLGYLVSKYNSESLIMATRATIKMSLKMAWKDFIHASKNIGVSRMKTATVRQTFNSDEPVSILSYNDDGIFLEGKMFNGSIMCAYILDCLGGVHPNFYPKVLNLKGFVDAALRDDALNAMARIMLHLYATFESKILMINSAYDFNSMVFKNQGAHLSCGWFSMSSKLKHSCEPNLFVLGLNNSIALVALRTIKKGEELTISYNGAWYDGAIRKVDGLRAAQLYLQTRQICEGECRICSPNWDGNTDNSVPMTETQKDLFVKAISYQKCTNYAGFYSMCRVLDAFQTNSAQHRFAYETMRAMLMPSQSKYFKNVTCF